MKIYKILAGVMLALFLFNPGTWSADTLPVKPSERDKCPVCGMFVAKYPDWVAQVVFEDASRYFFDGAKDLFKFYFNLKKYAPSQTREKIAGIYVTEYYDMALIDARQAIFVIGSDVYGPMGRELIPLKTEADAQQFADDHRGKQQVRFAEITTHLIDGLDD
ncbi:MAG: nitrous oxide reductase accessory protein NosL [Desulfobacterales bacterium]